MLALVTLLLAACGQGSDQADDARQQRDPRPETLEWTDGTGDMWAAKFAADDSFIADEPRPASTNGDIRHVTVAHRRESLELKVKYTVLDDVEVMVPLRAFLDTDLGIASEISVSWDGPAREAFVNIVNESSHIECKAASASVDFDGNTATVRVPRSCLGLPRWVRVYLESEIEQSKNYREEPVHMDSAMDGGFPAATRQDGTHIERVFSERVYADSPSSPSGRGESTLLLPDPRGDVVRIGPEVDEFSEGTPAPQQKDGDILLTKVEHTATQLRVRVELAQILRAPKFRTYRLAADVKTNAGTWGIEDEMKAGPGARSRPVLYVGDARVPCDVDRSIDYADRTSTWGIPRTCLGDDPAWVKLSLVLVTWQAGGAATIDDAHTKGYDDSIMFSRRVFKP
jgi:hypothetical protein